MARVGPQVRFFVRGKTGFAIGSMTAAAGPGFALLAFAAGFTLFPLRVVGPDFAHLPGDVVDNRLNNYVLEHGYRYLTGRVPEFWHAPFCYPARWMTARSDAHLGNLPAYAMFRAVGAGPERAFQIWWLSTFGLNFASAVWAARRLGVGWVGAAVGGYVFAFGLPVAASLPHAQLAPRYFVPPAVAIAWTGLARPSWRPLAGVAVCAVGQTYCTVYIGYFLGLLLAAVAVAGVLCLGGSSSPGWRSWRWRPQRWCRSSVRTTPPARTATRPRRALSFNSRRSRSIGPGRRRRPSPGKGSAGLRP
jgi:hypothetical protein